MNNRIKLILSPLLFASVSLATDKGGLIEDKSDAQGGTGSSLTINFERNFVITGNTVITVDGETTPQLRADAQGGTGYKVRYRVGNDVDGNITSGTLDEIDLINTHKGPITSLDPFRVFNVDVLITGNTFFDDQLNFEDLVIGEEIKVSGFVDANSSLLATRVERDNDPLTEWKLSGYVANLGVSQFNIGNQLVDFSGITPQDCDNGLSNGSFVEVKANPDNPFITNDPLTTVTKVECVPEGITGIPGDVIPAALEGIIDTVGVNSNFTVAGQSIEVNGSTVYVNGEAEDILVGSKVEVEGLLNTTTSVLQAVKIKFLEVRFKFEEPVNPGDVVPGESISLFGKTILSTPQLRDEDGIMANGLTERTQVEVRGYTDREGQLFATRVRERGNPDTSDINLDGPITAINPPQLEVLGIVVDTSSSFFLDQQGMPLSQNDFFNQISVGTEVEIDDAIVNELNNTVSGGTVQIDEDSSVSRNLHQNNDFLGENFGLGVGTITGASDLIFKNGFE